MKRIKWKLTLWWRTTMWGPMCQACEERHTDAPLGQRLCRMRQSYDEKYVAFMREYGERP